LKEGEENTLSRPSHEWFHKQKKRTTADPFFRKKRGVGRVKKNERERRSGTRDRKKDPGGKRKVTITYIRSLKNKGEGGKRVKKGVKKKKKKRKSPKTL